MTIEQIRAVLIEGGDRCPKYRFHTREGVRLLQEQRKRGEAKPDSVSFGDWYGPLKLSTKHRKACLMICGGMLSRYAARHINMTEARLSVMLSSTLARVYCAQLSGRFTYKTLNRRARNWDPVEACFTGAW